MASLRERNRNQTRRAIEVAALDLFERNGYDETNVDEIAEQAGISRATFFRYYPTKEDVLFTSEEQAVEAMVASVASRSDSSQSLAALAAPLAEFAHGFLEDDSSEALRLTRLVMTTRELEARSMRMRLLWERALTRQLASERDDTPTPTDVVLANVAIGCLAAALWSWQASTDNLDIAKFTRQMFDTARSIAS